MRNYYLLLPFTFTITAASAQTQPMDIATLDRDLNTIRVTAGTSWETEHGAIGNAFFDQDWDQGYIRLDDGRTAKDVPLKFNIYTNEIYYLKRDSQVVVIDASVIRVVEFGLHGKERSAVFHRGFPAVGPHTTNTFYEVLAAGKLTLLKLHSKKIVERTNLDHVITKQIADAESWYVFDTKTNSMSEFRKNKNSILESLPAYATEIRTVLDRDKLKVKNDSDLAALFNTLNTNQ